MIYMIVSATVIVHTCIHTHVLYSLLYYGGRWLHVHREDVDKGRDIAMGYVAMEGRRNTVTREDMYARQVAKRAGVHESCKYA